MPSSNKEWDACDEFIKANELERRPAPEKVPRKYFLTRLPTDASISRIFKVVIEGRLEHSVPKGYFYHKMDVVTGSFHLEDMIGIYHAIKETK